MQSFYDFRGWYTNNEALGLGSGSEIANPGDPVVGQLYPFWNGTAWENKEYEEPMPTESNKRHITKLAFRQRFTQAERIAIEIASLDKPNGTQQERETAAAIRSYLKDVDVARFIDLDRVDLQTGVSFLETLSILSPGRANEIITQEVMPEER